MQYDRDRRSPDPRSPVQPGPSSTPYFLAAVVAAVAVWAIQQNWVQDSMSSGPSESPRAQQAKGDPRTVFSTNDYPAKALQRGEQGTVQTQLTIDKRGRVSQCLIIRSSGHESLDEATCRILRKRARFTPARDREGKAVPDTYVTPPITWQIAD